jgi:hypothetical protein
VKKLMAVALAALLLVPLVAAPADAWVAHGGGWHGGGGGGGGWHGHGCCWGWGGFGVGVAVGTLATAPLWYPPYAYGYPAYAYPYAAYPAYPAYPGYSYPAYSYPTTPPPAYTPSDAGAMGQPSQSATVSSPAYSPPPSQGSAPASGQNCQTVTVEGHNETRTGQNGQSVTAWVPAYTQQICQ